MIEASISLAEHVLVVCPTALRIPQVISLIVPVSVCMLTVVAAIKSVVQLGAQGTLALTPTPTPTITQYQP